MSGSRRGAVALLALLALLGVMTLPAVAASGSWVATTSAVRVAMVEREVASKPLAPSGGVPAGRIDSVIWAFDAPAGAPVRGRLCHAGGCQALSSSRGRSVEMAGLPAGTPLHFRFSLTPGERRAVTVQGLKIIVNYR